MTLSDVSIKNPVFAWMLMFGLIFFGFLCFLRMGLSQMPDVEFPVVNVSITLPNASAVIMESDVADVVEDAVLGVEGVQDVQTTCTQGNVSISVFLDLSQDPNVAVQEVQTAVFAVEKQLPTNTYPPIIKELDPNSSPIFWMAITADAPLTLKDMMLYVRDTLKDHYTKLSGVNGVSLGGWINREVNIWVDNNKLTARYLTADDIVNTINNQHSEVPVGYMETPLTEYEVRSMGEAAAVKDFENLPILTRGGQPNYKPTPLKEVATIEDGLAPVTRISRFNGTPCVGLGIVMTDGYNAVKLVQEVKAQMAKDVAVLPKGYHLLTNFDTTISIEDNVHELELTIALAAILTSLVCYFFLGSWSSTLNIFLAIPTSLFGTFILISLFGFTMNMFTLMALSLSIGIVVDDAIMVMENIMRHQEEGTEKVEAALKGAREVIFAAVATSIAIVAIFLPVAFMSGIIGKFFFQFGVTLSGAVMISLLEAVTLTPMRCSQFVQAADHTKGFNLWVKTHMDRLVAFYVKVLQWCLDYPVDRLLSEARTGQLPWFKSLVSKLFLTHPQALAKDAQEEIKDPRYSLAPVLWLIVGLVVLGLVKAWKEPWGFRILGPLFLLGVLFYLWKHRSFLLAHLLYDRRWMVVFGALVIFAGSLFLAKIIKKEMVPGTDQSVFVISLQLPTDYSIFRTDGVVKQCEAALRSRGEIQNLYVAIGGFGASASNSAIIFVTMKPMGKRPVVPWSEKFPPTGVLGFVSKLYDKLIHPQLTQAEFMEVCRKALGKISPDLQVFLVDLSKRGLSTGKGYDVEFIVTGPDWASLAQYSAQIQKQMHASPLLADVNNNLLTGLPEIQIVPDREKAAAEAVNIADLGAVLGVMIGGYTFESVYYHETGHDNPIFIRMPQEQRLKPEDLKTIYTSNNRGELVSVADVTDITEVPALEQITRDNRLRAIYFYANASPTATGQVAMDEAMKIAKKVLPEGYQAALTGTSAAGSQTNSQLILTMGLGIIVAYMVLATQFNSFVQPWVILLALPFSITGAFAALFLFNQSLNMYSLIGLVLLLGLVKKNSIMIVAFTNQARDKGSSLRDALLYACPMRLRPILMTSIAIIAGAVPSAMALGPGAELRQPMSVAVIGGILFSTLLTLVVVPCAYSLMANWERPDAVKFKKDADGNLEAEVPKKEEPSKPATPAEPPASPKPVLSILIWLLEGAMALGLCPVRAQELSFSPPQRLVTLMTGRDSSGEPASAVEWLVVDELGRFWLESNQGFDLYSSGGRHLKRIDLRDKLDDPFGFDSMEALRRGRIALLERNESRTEQLAKDNFELRSKPGAYLVVLDMDGNWEEDRNLVDAAEPHSFYQLDRGSVYSVHDDGSDRLLDSVDAPQKDPFFAPFAAIAFNKEHWRNHLKTLSVFRSESQAHHGRTGKAAMDLEARSFLMGHSLVESTGPLAERAGKIYYQVLCDEQDAFVSFVFVEDQVLQRYSMVRLEVTDRKLKRVRDHALFADEKGDLYEGVAKADGYQIYEWKIQP